MAGSKARLNLLLPTDHAMTREMAPVLVGQITERAVDLAQVFLDAFEIIETRIVSEICADPPERSEWNERPGIIDDEASNRRRDENRGAHIRRSIFRACCFRRALLDMRSNAAFPQWVA